MVTFPPPVSRVRVIGGPAGSAVGPTGPAGLPGSALLVGATGLIGPTGRLGPTGSAGLFGLASLLTGATGRAGPTGSSGYPGPKGATGAFEFIPEDRVQYYENPVGYTLTTSGAAVGCKFFYTPKKEGSILFAMFTGLAEPTDTDVFQIGAGSGTGAAPNPGETSGYGDALEISGAGLSIPFFLTYYFYYRHELVGEFPYPDRWFDLSSYGGGGTVRNIACIVVEF
jgi:hypothetical protein